MNIELSALNKVASINRSMKSIILEINGLNAFCYGRSFFYYAKMFPGMSICTNCSK